MGLDESNMKSANKKPREQVYVMRPPEQ
jgi:hypothetical protein